MLGCHKQKGPYLSAQELVCCSSFLLLPLFSAPECKSVEVVAISYSNEEGRSGRKKQEGGVEEWEEKVESERSGSESGKVVREIV